MVGSWQLVQTERFGGLIALCALRAPRRDEEIRFFGTAIFNSFKEKSGQYDRSCPMNPKGLGKFQFFQSGKRTFPDIVFTMAPLMVSVAATLWAQATTVIGTHGHHGEIQQ